MKKAFMIGLALCLTLMISGTALATHEIGIPTPEGGTAGLTVGAGIRARGIIKNYDMSGDADPASYFDARGRFLFGYTTGDYKARLQFEIGDVTWESANRDAKVVEVKHLFIAGPLGPLAITAGLQPLSLGHSILLDEDFFGIVAGYNMGAGNLNIIYVKDAEGTTTAKDDVDLFGVNYAGAFGGFKISPYFVYGVYGEDAADGNLFWIGVPVDGTLGPVVLNAEFIYDGGSLGDVDYSGMAAWGKGTFALGAAKVYGEVGYASGDDKADDEQKAFVPIASYVVYDVVWHGDGGDNAATGKGNFFTNLLYFKLGGEYNLGALKLGAAVIMDNFAEGDETAAGTEVDVTAAYSLASNVTLSAQYGLFMPGDAYGDDAENIYKFLWQAVYSY